MLFVLEENLDVFKLAVDDQLKIIIDAGNQFTIVILKSLEYLCSFGALPI
jgi:hypothetical protein